MREQLTGQQKVEDSAWVADQKSFIEETRDNRNEEKSDGLKRGDELSILEYMERGKNDLWMFDNAHRRVFRHLIARPGIVRFNHDTFPRRARAIGLSERGELYLPRLFLDSFYDMEYVLDSLTKFSFNSARGAEASLQMFAMWGAPGVAKSKLVDFMRDNLNDAPLLHLKGCPIKDHPLLIIPKHLRDHYAVALGIKIPKDEDVCLVCRHNLETKYDWKWEDFPVEVNTISSRRNVGSAAVAPYDPNTTGSEVLIGDEKFWLPGSVPLAERLRFEIGAFAQASGGILEFREIFKAPKEVRNLPLIATQDKQWPTPNYYEWVSSNFFIIVHANIPEVVRWRMQEDNDAFFDRIDSKLVPYTLSFRGEERIYEKMLARGEKPRELSEEETEEMEEAKAGITKSMLVPSPELLIDSNNEPHKGRFSITFPAQFAIASRLTLQGEGDQEELMGSQLRSTIIALDGGAEDFDANDYFDAHPTDGFKGLSTRFVVKAIDDAHAVALLRWDRKINSSGESKLERKTACMTLEDVRYALERRLRQEVTLASLSESKREVAKWSRWLELVGGNEGSFTYAFHRALKQVIYVELQENGILDDIVGAEKIKREITEVFEQYKIMLFLSQEHEAENGSASESIDEEFMHAIERLIGVSESAAKEFRAALSREMEERRRAHDSLSPENLSNDPFEEIRRAAEQYVLLTRRDEYLRDILDYAKSRATTALSFERSSLSKLPGFCRLCAVWALEQVCSPVVRQPDKPDQPVA